MRVQCITIINYTSIHHFSDVDYATFSSAFEWMINILNIISYCTICSITLDNQLAAQGYLNQIFYHCLWTAVPKDIQSAIMRHYQQWNNCVFSPSSAHNQYITQSQKPLIVSTDQYESHLAVYLAEEQTKCVLPVVDGIKRKRLRCFAVSIPRRLHFYQPPLWVHANNAVQQNTLYVQCNTAHIITVYPFTVDLIPLRLYTLTHHF